MVTPAPDMTGAGEGGGRAPAHELSQPLQPWPVLSPPPECLPLPSFLCFQGFRFYPDNPGSFFKVQVGPHLLLQEGFSDSLAQ